MGVLLEIGIAGWLILCIQLSVFCLLLTLGLRVTKSSRALLSCLSRCLRESRDLVTEADSGLNIARACATRYRHAAERIENIDAYAICSSEVSRASAISFAGHRWSYSKIDDLLHGGPGFLVTLGLIGTFVGLMGNMIQLSELVLASETTAQQSSLLSGLAAVFPSMAAAFSTSLLGVSLSCILWLVGTATGMLSLKQELTEHLAGYLEQVVQADCRRYSLIGESMERMEKYLTEYLSTFSSKVSASIEHAIQANIRNLVSSLSSQVLETKALVTQVRQGSERLADAGITFFNASRVLNETDFAEKFGISCETFLQCTDAVSASSKLLIEASTTNSVSSQALTGSISAAIDIIDKLSTSLISTDMRASELISLTIQSNEKLVDATTSVESIQKRGMTWLSMRAKTDQQLMEINSELNKAVSSITNVAEQVASTRLSDVNEISNGIASLNQTVNELSQTVQRQTLAVQSVVEGLRQMQATTNRLLELS